MTRREITQASRLLACVGREVIGTTIDYRGKRPVVAIETDGDGRSQDFGSPLIFSTLESVRDYVGAHTP